MNEHVHQLVPVKEIPRSIPLMTVMVNGTHVSHEQVIVRISVQNRAYEFLDQFVLLIKQLKVLQPLGLRAEWSEGVTLTVRWDVEINGFFSEIKDRVKVPDKRGLDHLVLGQLNAVFHQHLALAPHEAQVLAKIPADPVQALIVVHLLLRLTKLLGWNLAGHDTHPTQGRPRAVNPFTYLPVTLAGDR